MKSLLILGLATLIGAGAQAQTAKVIPLSEQDAAEIKALYKQQDDIKQKIEDFQTHVVKTYTTEAMSVFCASGNVVGFGDRSPSRCSKLGWNYGFIYSEDFKYIVPTTVEVNSIATSNCIITPSVEPFSAPAASPPILRNNRMAWDNTVGGGRNLE